MHLVLSTGMQLEQVREQFDFPRLEAFNKYCDRFPPQHVLIASYFGFGKEKAKQADQNDELAAILGQIPQVQR